MDLSDNLLSWLPIVELAIFLLLCLLVYLAIYGKCVHNLPMLKSMKDMASWFFSNTIVFLMPGIIIGFIGLVFYLVYTVLFSHPLY